MAGTKISALPPVGAALSTDIFPVVQGGVTSRETVAQLTTLIGSSLVGSFVPIAGGTMTGPLILSADPTLPLQAATKEYVDQFAAGIVVVLACQAATTVNLNAIQAGAGVGATLTNNGALAAFQVDGYAANLNDRILVKDQTLPQHNGIYDVTTVGNGAIAWVLTRATDYDQVAEIFPGTLVTVVNGTVNAVTSWLETATVAIVDTDPILFSQFTFGPTSFLLRANNLSDLLNVPAALVNLGLGIPTGTGNVVLQTSPTLITPTLGVATATSLVFSPTTNGIIGTTTNDNAIAGRVGEFMSSIVLFAARVPLADIIPRNVTSLALTAGDWDVWGNVFFTSVAGSYGNIICWTSTTSATQPDPALLSSIAVGGNVMAGGGMNVPKQRYSLAAPTTVYLSCNQDLSTGAGHAACGAIYARRRR